MKIATLLFVLVIFPISLYSAGLEDTKEFKNLNEIQLVLQVAPNRTIRVVATRIVPVRPFPYEFKFWGIAHYGQEPKTVLQKLSVTVNDEEVSSRTSAFMGLASPRVISVKNLNEKDFVIFVQGSDAGGSYKANFFYSNLQLKRREVFDSEMSDTAWEKTEYSYTTNN